LPQPASLSSVVQTQYLFAVSGTPVPMVCPSFSSCVLILRPTAVEDSCILADRYQDYLNISSLRGRSSDLARSTCSVATYLNSHPTAGLCKYWTGGARRSMRHEPCRDRQIPRPISSLHVCQSIPFEFSATCLLTRLDQFSLNSTSHLFSCRRTVT